MRAVPTSWMISPPFEMALDGSGGSETSVPPSLSIRDFIDSWNADVVHGTVDEVRTRLDDLHKRTGADELMLTTHAHSPDLRLRSYELIADAYDLPRTARTDGDR